MAVVFNVLSWLLSFLPDDKIQFEFMKMIGYIHDNSVAGLDGHEGVWSIVFPLSMVNYVLPLDLLLVCINSICMAVFASLMVCFGKLVFNWLIKLLGIIF